MYNYRFTDGHEITTKLSKEEVLKRMDRLDTLRVLTEGYETGEGHNIFRKAFEAWNKEDNFTGIIRLNRLEKDFLSYMLENDMLNDDDVSVINYYLRH